MAAGDDSKTIPYQMLVVIGGSITAFVVILKIGFWALQQKPDELKGPPVTVTVHAELDPGMESEALTVQFYRDGGSFLTERKLPSGVVNLSASSPKASAEVVLPGSGNIRYEVFGTCKLVSKQAHGICNRKSEDENDSMFPGEPIFIQGNTTLHVARSVPQNEVRDPGRSMPVQFMYSYRLQAKPAPNPQAFSDLALVARQVREKGTAVVPVTDRVKNAAPPNGRRRRATQGRDERHIRSRRSRPRGRRSDPVVGRE